MIHNITNKIFFTNDVHKMVSVQKIIIESTIPRLLRFLIALKKSKQFNLRYYELSEQLSIFQRLFCAFKTKFLP